MKKILLVATVQSHICQFHLPIMEMLKENGFIVHVAARDNLKEKNGLRMKFADKVYDIPFERSPLNCKNIKAYKQLKKIIEDGSYDIVHCNTPVGGIVTRIAANKYRKKGVRVIYTAHGFHFYKGSSFKNWILYYPIEKIMSLLSDDIITITEEDYNLAINKNFKGKIHHINGIGVNSKKFIKLSDKNREKLRNKMGYGDEFIILCTGELNKNKNQSILIKAMSNVVRNNKNVKLLLAGNGPMEEELVKLINELDLQDNIQLLGYRTDLENFVNICDLVVSVSIREGMPLNIMEAMICGKPVVASYNRGHRELIKNKINGLLIDPYNEKEIAKAICFIMNNISLSKDYVAKSLEYVKPYDVNNVKNKLKEIYLKDEN